MNTHQSQHNAASKPYRYAGAWLLAVGIILIGANLRPAITSVGPLVGMIRDSLGISNTISGMLTTLPLLAFALLSPFVPRLSRRFGASRIISAALLLLTLGIVVRSLAGLSALFIGTAMLGLAIAVCNVLLPSLIKEQFPNNTGVMTGVYSVSMNLCAAIASGISVPIAKYGGMGWSGSLSLWAITSAAAFLLWLPQMRRHRASSPQHTVNTARPKRPWKSSIAWMVTVFMGLQSVLFYVVIAWFPAIMGERGMDTATAGWMLSFMQFAQMPFTFIVPILASRMKDQRLLVIIMAALYLIGIGGLAAGFQNLTVIWVICIGIAGGFAFGLAMMFFNLRTQTAYEAAELSGMAQSVGYLLAAAGPTLFGFLHDATDSWAIPLTLLLGVTVLILLAGLGAGKNRYIGQV